MRMQSDFGVDALKWFEWVLTGEYEDSESW